MLGASCTLKLFPGVMVLFLLLSRRFRAVAAAAAVYLTIAGIMTSRYGFACWPQFFAMQGPISQHWMMNIRNGSPHGIVLHVLRPVCAATRPITWQISALSSGLALVLLVLAWLLSRRTALLAAQDPRATREIDLPFALFSVLSGFLNPWVWEHYNVLLLLPLGISLVTLYGLWQDGDRRRLWAVVGFVVVAAILYLLSIDMQDKVGLPRAYQLAPSPKLHRRLHLLEAVNWMPMVLTLILLSGLISLKRASPGTQKER
jgi:hypothetical protein